MSQSWLVVGIFVLVIVCLPYLVRRVQAYAGIGLRADDDNKVVSVLAVGPQQRVVTVRVVCGSHRATLVLGVTSTSVNCLHKWDPSAAGAPTAVVLDDGLQ